MQTITIRSYETKKNILTPIIFLIVGIILIVNPAGIFKFVSYIFGGVFLALGIAKMILDSRRFDKTSGDMFYSSIMIVLGIIFMFFSGTIEFIIRLAIGSWIIINGLNTIAIGANLMKMDKKSIASLVIGFILLMIGLYTVFVSNLVLSSIGLVISIYAVLDIINYFYIASKNR